MTSEQEIFRSYQTLKALKDLSALDNEKALHYLGCLVDLAYDFDDTESLDKAIAWAADLSARTLSESDKAELLYFTANAWGNKLALINRNTEAVWNWEQPEALNQILYSRRAWRHPHFKQWTTVRRAQVLTNLGNQLNALGRFVEAIGCWNEALAIYPNFGMARGNRGLGLLEYAVRIFDPNHQSPLYVAAYRELEFALSSDASYEGYASDRAKTIFEAKKNKIGSAKKIKKAEQELNLDNFSLGESDEERRYRKWALSECLFLNPLNDIGPIHAAAADTFVLPSFTTKIGETPTWLGFFNQLKQEYVSARWLIFESMQVDQSHFSDRDVTLYNTLDYPAYGLGAERMKIAFRMAYSLFDKIGFFLNDYAALKMPERHVYFRTVWFKPGTKKLRDEFSQRQNVSWRALYWLSKDLFDDELKAASDPDAEELSIIRNRLEHSYLKLHEIGAGDGPGELFHDRMAYSLNADEFRRRTLRVLKRARAALIYLALGMEREEKMREDEDKASGKLTVPMSLGTLDDEWKR